MTIWAWRWLSLLLLAVAVCWMGLAWRGWRRLPRVESAAADVPVGWRWLLAGLRACAWCARPWVAGPGQQARQRWLRHAGLDHVLDAVLLGTAQCLLAACVGVLWLLSGGAYAWGAAVVALAGYAPYAWVKARARQRCEQMAAQVPLLLDMLALGLASGQHFNAALSLVLRHLPPGTLHEALRLTWRDIRQGRPRVDAMRALAWRTGVPSLQRLAATLAQAETLGMSLAPLLRAQSQQCQEERFQRAERLALEAPVKMLLPLVVCLLPATFLVLAYPVLYYLTGTGDGG